MSLNEAIRNNELQPNGAFGFETGFLDLLNTYNSVGVRGENSIIKGIPVSSSFCYLVSDSVVAPHDKIDVSRQSIKTLQFTFTNVHGDIIKLHGAHISFSLIFQTIE